MALYMSPLVDVNEIDLSTTIPAVATSIAVAVIRNPWKGQERKKILVTSRDELIDTVGEPTSGSYKDILSAAGYLKYGNKLYITVAFPDDARFAGTYGSIGSSAGSFTAYTAGASGAYRLDDFDSEDPDEFGNESVVFDSTREDKNANIAFIANSRGKWGNYVRIACTGKYAYNAVKKGTLNATQLGMSDDLYDALTAIDVGFDSVDDKEFLVIVSAADQPDTKKTAIPYSVKETWLVSTNDRAVDDEGRSMFCEDVINLQSDYVRIALREAYVGSGVEYFWTADWQDFAGGVSRASTALTDTVIINSYKLYENPEEVDVNMFIDSDKSSTVKQELISICESRKDAMAILDVPYSMVVNNGGSEVTDLRDWRNGLHSTYNLNENTSYAAVYANWLEIYDQWNQKYRWIPASGHAAGIYANTDDVSDPWFAPAGLNRAILTNVRKLAFNPTLGERDILYTAGLNPIVSFAGQGKVIWGQKTYYDKSSAFNRVNVRRLFMILEKAISTAAVYFLFEPNDTFTRLQLINLIEPFLRDVQSRRGIYDFLVVCDSTNNTPERIDRNELWCDIYIKPTRAAEFIVLNFIATKTGANFTELAAAAANATA